jgi:hypothetical protein
MTAAKRAFRNAGVPTRQRYSRAKKSADERNAAGTKRLLRGSPFFKTVSLGKMIDGQILSIF